MAGNLLRELSATEAAAFLRDHADIAAAVEGRFGNTIPEYGVVVRDGARYVLVFRDAVGKWHYTIGIESLPQFAELVQNKPEFASPDGSMIDGVMDQLKHFSDTATGAVDTVIKVMVAAAVVFVVFEIVQASKAVRS